MKGTKSTKFKISVKKLDPKKNFIHIFLAKEGFYAHISCPLSSSEHKLGKIMRTGSFQIWSVPHKDYGAVTILVIGPNY